MTEKMTPLEEKLADAGEASEQMRTSRTHARSAAVTAIRDLEKRLVDTLAGDALRGLANLTESTKHPFHAARVHGQTFGIDSALPSARKETLVITREGSLAMAARLPDNSAYVRPVMDSELMAQSLEPIAAAVLKVLERHIQRAKESSENYERIAALASVLSDATGSTEF